MTKHNPIQKKVFASLTIAFLLLANIIQAEPISAADWLKDDQRFKEFCKQQVYIGSGKVFSDTVIKANTIRKDYCERRIATDQELLMRIFNLFDDLERLFVAQSHPQKLKQFQTQRLLNKQNPAKFELFTNNNITMVLAGKLFKVTNVSQCNNRANEIAPAQNCKSALKEFKAIYDFAEGTYAQPKALPLIKHLSDLEKEWDDFYKNSRSQTLLEMLINGALFQSDNQEHRFMSPPDSQIIFMHPGLVIENIDDAVDGNQTKEALMLELIGINYWRERDWYVPSGGSIIALYSDRPAIHDVGYGIAIHFANKFTLGYSDHGSQEGYFISVDLLELLKDKKTLLNEYRGSLEF